MQPNPRSSQSNIPPKLCVSHRERLSNCRAMRRTVHHRHHFAQLLLLTLYTQLAFVQAQPISLRVRRPCRRPFCDVTDRVGLLKPNERFRKFGGPVVADLDNDGYPDLVLVHHNRHTQVYFNNRMGGFVPSSFPNTPKRDTHSAAVAPVSAFSRSRYIVVTNGGSMGTNFSFPYIYRVEPDRTFKPVSKHLGVEGVLGRSRAALFMTLNRSRLQYPDLVITNLRTLPDGPQPHLVYFLQQTRDGMSQTSAAAMTDTQSRNIVPVDIDGDGFMELFAFHPHGLSVFKMGDEPPYAAMDVTKDVLPPSFRAARRKEGVQAIAEFDFDNDGDFDVIIIRSWALMSERRLRGPVEVFQNILLENRGGRLIDVSGRAGFRNRTSRAVGVTTADFNNDGFLDVLLINHDTPDEILYGQGDGTFKARRAGIAKGRNVTGDHAVAVDYDLDGWVDAIVGQGGRFKPSKGGPYRVLRNSLGASSTNRWLLVAVGTSPGRRATGLHAVVTCRSDGHTFVRRVGSPGSSTSASFLETLHFGLGDRQVIDEVSVRWQSGFSQTRVNVTTNQRISFGRV